MITETQRKAREIIIFRFLKDLGSILEGTKSEDIDYMVVVENINELFSTFLESVK